MFKDIYFDTLKKYRILSEVCVFSGLLSFSIRIITSNVSDSACLSSLFGDLSKQWSKVFKL